MKGIIKVVIIITKKPFKMKISRFFLDRKKYLSDITNMGRMYVHLFGDFTELTFLLITNK